MGFKRANWHSGLTYEHQCEQCKTIVVYNDYLLDFRPWYADGFVYCPKCKTPLRHNEKYAVNATTQTATTTAQNETSEIALFCTQCGRKYLDGENYCPNCGNKR